MISIQKIIEHLSDCVSDPVPKYIFIREICKKSPPSLEYINAYEEMKLSKWYLELIGEQWEDGSWGRFHSQDSQAQKKQKFSTTESALGRARELSLTKDDPMIAKCLNKVEKYANGDETWTDRVEMHKDGGKSHLFCRPYVSAAVINTFDPNNPFIKPLRDTVVTSLRKAFENGFFDEKVWEQEIREYRVPSIAGPGMYSSMLLRNTNCMEDTLQRQYLDYIWNSKNGIYYVSSMPPADKRCLEDKRFFEWISSLELLSGFSLFSEFMRNHALPHLINEVGRIIDENVELPISTRYSDNWRDKNKQKTDAILRISRLIVKC